MPKAPHGTGHVYVKWGSFYGRWRSPDGRPLNRRIGKVRERGTCDGLTRRQAESALRELIAAETARPRRPFDEPGKTVDDALDALRARLALEGARPSYMENCESMQRVHLSPRLGSRRLQTVDREAVEHLALAMLRKGSEGLWETSALKPPTTKSPQGEANHAVGGTDSPRGSSD